MGSSPPPKVDVAIVGAGASGLLCVAHMTRIAALQAVSLLVALIDPSSPEAAGPAYSTTHAEHVMNVRACRLSAFDDEPDHFVEWTAAQGTPIHPDDFAPRMMYGRYVRSVAAHPMGEAPVQRIRQRCTGIDHADDGSRNVRITLENGEFLDAEQVVLALGNAKPVPLAGPATVVIDDPWDDAGVGQIAADDDVVVVGSGLTAVDTVLALETAGHRGRVTVVSRHGRWPAAHVGAPLTCVVPSGRPMDVATFGLHPTARTIVAAVRRALAATTIGRT
jgi:uncharacterized NAD(P)/FAD-binding protein YdhS